MPLDSYEERFQNQAVANQTPMIPRIIHYCWFGRGPMPEMAQRCIASWHRYMPDYKYKLWDENNFDINSNIYVREAYEAHKYAFVSDYVRLFALYNEGGIYMDTDVEVLKHYDDLLHLTGFIGFEGSKRSQDFFRCSYYRPLPPPFFAGLKARRSRQLLLWAACRSW